MNTPALFLFLRPVALVIVLAASSAARLPAAEPATNAPAKPAEPAAVEVATNAPAELRVTPQLIEQIRREIEQTSARNAEAITSSLNLIEPALARMQQRQAESLQSANRTILIIAGLFAALGFAALVVITLILVRALGRFSELAVSGSGRREIGPGAAPAALEHSGSPTPDGAVEQSSARFQGALEQLQRRIFELEHGLQGSSVEAMRNQSAPPRALTAQTNGTSAPTTLAFQPATEAARPTPTASSPEAAEPGARAAVLLGKGQTLLNLGEADEALACFEQALTVSPNNADALVKRGLALEQLENLSGALESYNRALALDGSMTVAYLYKGGVCNRLQRYQEALASYEQALQTERKSRAS